MSPHPWRQLIGDEASFGPAATPEDLDAIADRLGAPVPEDLAALLTEVGAVQDADGTDIVWPADRILADNLRFRTDTSFADLYMPFDPLLFFGDGGDGCQFAYVRRPLRPDIFVWDHESDGRWWVANDLTDFLRRRSADPEFHRAP